MNDATAHRLPRTVRSPRSTRPTRDHRRPLLDRDLEVARSCPSSTRGGPRASARAARSANQGRGSAPRGGTVISPATRSPARSARPDERRRPRRGRSPTSGALGPGSPRPGRSRPGRARRCPGPAPAGRPCASSDTHRRERPDLVALEVADEVPPVTAGERRQLGRLGHQLLGPVLPQVGAARGERAGRIRSTGTVLVAATIRTDAGSRPDPRRPRPPRGPHPRPRSATDGPGVGAGSVAAGSLIGAP